MLGCLFLSACVNQPQTYAPPIQRQPMLDGQAPKPPKQIVDMGDKDADAYIVQDIARAASDPWRWTGKRPTVRLYVADPNGRKLRAAYSIAGATFKDTGPVKLTFYINGKAFETVTENEPGQKTFEKAVPPEFLKPASDNLLAIEIDKLWVAPADGATLGFIIASLGLTR